MSELLAWDGPWSPDLIRLMLPVAVEIHAKRDLSFYQGALAAVASIFKKEVGKEYSDSLEDVLQKVREEQLEARGYSRQDIIDMRMEKFAQQLLRLKGMKRR